MDKQAIIDRAVAYKASGNFNCAQAVACAFADRLQVDADTLYNSGNAFGRGMGCMQATCGALVGAGIALGYATHDRQAAMKAMAEIHTRFQQQNGATICRELKGIGTGKPLRSCPGCVADAASFLADILGNRDNITKEQPPIV